MSDTDLRAALEPLIDEVYQRGMDAPEAADFMVAALRAALVTDSRPESIDAAWTAVEAVLPEGWWLSLRRTDAGWNAIADGPAAPAMFPLRNQWQTYQPAPADALRALEARLAHPAEAEEKPDVV